MTKTTTYAIRGARFYPYRGFAEWLKLYGKTRQEFFSELKQDRQKLYAQDFFGEWREIGTDGKLVGEYLPQGLS